MDDLKTRHPTYGTLVRSVMKRLFFPWKIKKKRLARPISDRLPSLRTKNDSAGRNLTGTIAEDDGGSRVPPLLQGTLPRPTHSLGGPPQLAPVTESNTNGAGGGGAVEYSKTLDVRPLPQQ